MTHPGVQQSGDGRTASREGARRPRRLLRPGRIVVVGIAQMRVSSDPDDLLVTYALGSCIAVLLHDPRLRVGGILHYMLPFSRTSPRKAVDRPAMFADTGVPMLFRAMYDLGSAKQDIVVKVAGGGNVQDEEGVFDIGRRNYSALRKLFWKNKVVISAEDVGGTISRTVKLDVRTGLVVVQSGGEEWML